MPPFLVATMGLLLPTSVLRSDLFAVLAAFVAINTVMYAALSLAKLLPKLYPGDWFSSPNRRSQTRSIYPEGEPSDQESVPCMTMEKATRPDPPVDPGTGERGPKQERVLVLRER